MRFWQSERANKTHMPEKKRLGNKRESRPKKEDGLSKGLISTFARHPTAANLLMALMVAAGLLGASRITTQFFPEVTIEQVNISIAWPGASANDVDKGIIVPLEQELRFLDNVETSIGSAREGRGIFYLEYESGTDMQAALGEVETAVAAINLPEDSETPKITVRPFRDRVAAIVVSGQMSLPELTVFATDLRDALLAAGIKEVTLTGDYAPEIVVNVREADLRRYGLTLDELASRIRSQSVDTPSGEISSGDRLVRSLGRRETVAEFASLPVRTLPDGGMITLSDLADVTERNSDNRVEALRNGNPAIELLVLRGSGGDTIKQLELMESVITEISASFPQSVKIETYRRRADLVKARIELLMRNGLQGLAIVLLMLVIFLNIRTAFWVAMGIPAALAATLALMYVSGQTINMISLFALIITLGIIVDDAIVVGEHADTLYSAGYTPAQSGILSARRMLGPVLASSLTTVFAFLSLIMIGGRFGDFLLAIPLAVSAVLVASLVECFFILPAHMRHALEQRNAREKRRRQDSRISQPFVALRKGFDSGFERVRSSFFIPLIAYVVKLRYPVLALAIVAVMLAIGMVRGGVVPKRFFVAPELNHLSANVEMTGSASREDTRAALRDLEMAIDKTVEGFLAKAAPDAKLADAPVKMVIVKLGQNLGWRSGDSATDPDLLGGIFIEFVEEGERNFTIREFSQAWRRAAPKHPKLANFSTRIGRAGPSQDDLEFVISGSDPETLKQASEDMAQALLGVSGVSDPTDDLPWGKAEIQLRLTPAGRALGFDEVALGTQLRQKLEGLTAMRLSRDGKEIDIKVKFEDAATTLSSLAAFDVRTPLGGYAPLTTVADVKERPGFSEIRSENGRRKVTITAEIDDKITNSELVSEGIATDVSPALTATYGVQVNSEGALEDERRFGQDALYGGLFGIACIYICLAWALGSYSWPFAVLLMLPLGAVGAVVGHWAQDYALSMFSVIGLFGLSGIVINDAIVMLTTIRRRQTDQDYISAIVHGTADRLRAIILTTVTTVGGLIPLMFEDSIQARFLIPTALTICWGLGVGSICVLIVLPALLAAIADIRRVFRSGRRYLPARQRLKKRQASVQT